MTIVLCMCHLSCVVCYHICIFVLFFFFFFQAEDGIRDHCVTGVQTCALPILRQQENPGVAPDTVEWRDRHQDRVKMIAERSEERRVGKECRSRWSAYH